MVYINTVNTQAIDVMNTVKTNSENYYSYLYFHSLFAVSLQYNYKYNLLCYQWWQWWMAGEQQKMKLNRSLVVIGWH